MVDSVTLAHEFPTALGPRSAVPEVRRSGGLYSLTTETTITGSP